MRYDSFLVHHLALELTRELAGKPVRALQFDSAEQRVLIDVGDIRLVWELHANKGAVTRTAPLYPLPDSAILPRKARIDCATSLPDERVLIIKLAGDRRENATHSVVIELLTNQWNAFALDHSDRVLRVLKARDVGRSFRRGQHYQAPEQPDTTRTRYRSPLNEQLADAEFERMLQEAPMPALLEEQPYPHHLWSAQARRFDSLLSAFAAIAGAESSEALLNELARRARAGVKKIERLNAELMRAREEERATRERADVLIAYASTVTRGVSRVVLPGFSGAEMAIDLKPELSAIDNAQLMYEEARKQQRAMKRIPGLIEQAQREQARNAALLERAQRGELSDNELREIAEKPAPRKQQQGPGERLPYRRYRTSSGLEVRVGRNARSNDELTLQHSSARDFWFHARHVGGAHVVLRWNDAEANPPQRDIMEAATLAAVHSGARTSGMVPVDYTRRKYVRKPRRSPPGTVMIERAKTVFVEPSEEMERRLRA